MAITLNANFQAENDKATNTPVLLVKLPETITDTVKNSSWSSNDGESNVDYANGYVTLDTSYAAAGYEEITSGSTTPDYDIVSYNSVSGAYSGALYWQRFSHVSISSTYLLATITLPVYWYRANGADPLPSLTLDLYDDFGGELLATDTYTFTGAESQSTKISIVFTLAENLESNKAYWMKISCSWTRPFAGNCIMRVYEAASSYVKGMFHVLWLENTTPAVYNKWIYNLTPQIAFKATTSATSASVHYTTSTGTIRVIFDCGSAPTVPGEWVFSHLIPAYTDLTYDADYSDNGSSWTNIGAVVDGTPITALHRYYRCEATLDADTSTPYTGGLPCYSPVIYSMGVRFIEWIKFANLPLFGAEPSLLTASSLNTTINRTALSTISQLTLTFDFTEKLSAWINSIKPKNKPIQVLAGFHNIAESNFEDYNYGVIDDWSIDSSDILTLTCKDHRKSWKKNVPESWEDTSDSVYFPGQHHVRIIRSLLQNQINVRDSTIDMDSFDAVETDLSGWMAGTEINDTRSAEDLINELRILMWCYFIPKPDGTIYLKKYDSSESAQYEFDDKIYHSLDYMGNSDALINRVVVYYSYDFSSENDTYADYADITIDFDATSQSDWGEIATYEIKDKWTYSGDDTQIDTLTAAVLDRFKDIPCMFKMTTDIKFWWLEVGDMVNITSARAPSSDYAGFTSKKFEIVGKNANFLSKSDITFQLLEV